MCRSNWSNTRANSLLRSPFLTPLVIRSPVLDCRRRLCRRELGGDGPMPSLFLFRETDPLRAGAKEVCVQVELVEHQDEFPTQNLHSLLHSSFQLQLEAGFVGDGNCSRASDSFFLMTDNLSSLFSFCILPSHITCLKNWKQCDYLVTT